MDKVSNSGRMALGTRVTGNSIRRTVKEHSGMFMETCTKVPGSMTRPTVTEPTRTPTEPSIRVNGKMIYNMVME